MTVYCIGLPRTGTTSLKEALKILGYSINQSGEDQAFIGDQMCIPLDRWKGIYKLKPEAKYIITYRDFEDWWQSIYRWSRKHENNEGLRRQRKGMYGHEMPMGDNKGDFYEIYADRILKIKDVIPTKSYLILKPEHGWDVLCKFLKKEIPKVDYPHLNKSK